MADTTSAAASKTYRQKHNLRSVQFHVSQDLHTRAARAAHDCEPPMQLSQWIRALMEAALPTEQPEKKSKKK